MVAFIFYSNQRILGAMDVLIKLMADGFVAAVVALGVYALLRYAPRGQRYQAYVRVLLAGLTAYVAAKLVGALYQPSALRPFELLGVDAGASFLPNPGFPSDHALFVVAITLAVWCVTARRWLSLLCLGLAFMVCVGRVVALVHTPLDVLGGAVIALTGAVWYLPLMQHKRYTK